MAKVITFSRHYPAYHPKKGQATDFMEKYWNSMRISTSYYSLISLNPGKENIVKDIWETVQFNFHKFGTKWHTIRSGSRFKEGEFFSPRVWSEVPYYSKQIIIGPDRYIDRIFHFELMPYNRLIINGKGHCSVSNPDRASKALEAFAKNDGLNARDLLDWFKYPKPIIDHQIICWNPSIKY